MKKRGQIDIQFNWIFVLIAGAIILAFFFSVINKQRTYSDIKTSQTIVTNLESIFTGASISTDTVNVIDLPQAKVEFECNQYKIGSVPRDTKGNIVFAPGFVEGKQMLTWALDWNVPFRVTNFLYVTDPQIRYVIVNNSKNLGETMREELPEDMQVEIVHYDQLADLEDRNNYKVKYIFLGAQDHTALDGFQGMEDEEVTGVSLPGLVNEGGIVSTGPITFWEKDGTAFRDDGSTFYLNQEALIGAIFSGDIEMYNCEMKKAFRKLDLMTSIYINRSVQLQHFFGTGNPCTARYATLRLNDLMIEAKEQSRRFPLDGVDPLDELRDLGVRIRDEQNQQLQLLSCPLIY